MSSRSWIVWACTLAGCGDSHRARTAAPSPLETQIARDLTARFATPVTVRCPGLVQQTCTATLADNTTFSIALSNRGKGEADWHVDGIVVEAKTVTPYVQQQLADLKLSDTVSCAPPVQVVHAGERVSCALSGGGVAFVQIAADGSTSLELALDKEAAAARGEALTPERDKDLTARSKALESSEESDGEDEAAPSDGGVAQP